MSMRRNRRRWIVVGLFAFGVVAGVTAYVLWISLRDGATLRAWVDDPYGEAGSWRPIAKFSDKLNSRAAYLQDDLLKRSAAWSMQEVGEVLAIIQPRYPHAELEREAARAREQGADSTPELDAIIEQMLLFNTAMLAAGERLRKDALGRSDRRIDPDAREALERVILGLLDDDSPVIRRRGATAIITSGLVAHAGVRRRIEEMIRSDPDEKVRESIRHTLARYDTVTDMASRYRQTFFASSGDQRKEGPETER